MAEIKRALFLHVWRSDSRELVWERVETACTVGLIISLKHQGIMSICSVPDTALGPSETLSHLILRPDDVGPLSAVCRDV